MAFEIPGFSFTMPAGADLSGSQFRFVNADTTAARSRAILTTAGGRAIGVLQNKPTSGLAATVVVDGISKVEVGAGGVTAGDTVQALADGRITTSAAGKYAVGIALQTGAVGTYVAVLLTPSGGGGLIA